MFKSFPAKTFKSSCAKKSKSSHMKTFTFCEKPPIEYFCIKNVVSAQYDLFIILFSFMICNAFCGDQIDAI